MFKHIRTVDLCGEKCALHVPCAAFEFNAKTQQCKTMPWYKHDVGRQKAGWVSCIQVSTVVGFKPQAFDSSAGVPPLLRLERQDDTVSTEIPTVRVSELFVPSLDSSPTEGIHRWIYVLPPVCLLVLAVLVAR